MAKVTISEIDNFHNIIKLIFLLIYNGCTASNGQEMDSNQSRAVGETIWDPFRGSLTHLGASGRLQSHIQAIPVQILTFPDTPCQLGQLKWSKMACTGVLHILPHLLLSTRTFGGISVSYSAILAVLGHQGAIYEKSATF